MDNDSRALSQSYLTARRQHPAWLLLASPRAPLLLSCLKPLFEVGHGSIEMEEALQRLAGLLARHGGDADLGVEGDDYAAIARRELRGWIKRGLVVEREGRLSATDALQQVMRFIEGLGERAMTSTASRLATVQREIENLESRLNPERESRAAHLRRKIAALQQELEEVEAGHFEVLDGSAAEEGIREVFNLAQSLRADFRRVEDSYREADRCLRHAIISERHHRGEIVDNLLDSHASLLETAEGKVFHGFYEQLHQKVELEQMKQRLRNILRTPAAATALSRPQQSELRWLIARLVGESGNVIRARARSERDVKGFLKTGLAAEHHRVGELLNQILESALHIDWSRAATRRAAAPLPPVGVAAGPLPLVERLRFKVVEGDEEEALDLRQQDVDLDEVDEEFWRAFDDLDRQALLDETRQLLDERGEALTVGQLSEALPPRHDLETLALWLSLAREAELPITEAREQVTLEDNDDRRLRFTIPRVALSAAALENIEWEV
ncbi:MAG: DUF3375 domain-containing protein [Gammaproteobacteria bacterium]|nr:DUF3375 domain-containing protein [Gammaproteobacteria bacterium]